MKFVTSYTPYFQVLAILAQSEKKESDDSSSQNSSLMPQDIESKKSVHTAINGKYCYDFFFFSAMKNGIVFHPFTCI